MERRKSRKSVVDPAFQGARRFDELHVFIDGAARGNPGPAAIGVVILTRQGRRVAAFGEAIGEATNNFAEYTALVHAMRLLSAYEVERLRIYADSELVVRQIQGLYRVRERSLRSLHSQVMSMLGRYRDWSIQHVPREQNREADRLANHALDVAGDRSQAAASRFGAPSEEQPTLFPEEEEG